MPSISQMMQNRGLRPLEIEEELKKPEPREV